MLPFSPGKLAELLLGWYAVNARRLPWRNHPDPYAVWVSEIMLQQTQVETVIPYFERWMARFPSLADLAAASEQDVLAVWEGLGYYSRARNFQRAAQQVVEQFNGKIPATRQELEHLPGLGRYSAAAIASMAFGQDEAALDGNIRRVLARVSNLELAPRSPDGEARLWALAAQCLPAGHAGEFNQALMDLGSSICTPRRPRCLLCPLAQVCQAYALGVQEQRPLKLPRPKIPHITVTAAVLERDGLLLIARRPSKGLLGGLWEFPGGKQEEGEDLPACLRRELDEELGVQVQVSELFGSYQHAYTHFRVTLHAFRCTLLNGEPQPLHASELRWVSLSQLKDFPMGKIDRAISRDLAG